MNSKQILIAFFCIIFFCSFSGFDVVNVSAQKTTNPSSDTLLADKTKKQYLELKGMIKQSKTNPKGKEDMLDSAQITVYEYVGNAKNKIYSFYSNSKGKCEIKLPLDKRYVLEVSKEGYVSKNFEINTKVPDKEKAAFVFPFTIDIFEKVDGLDVSVLSKPIAKVNYSFTYDQFDYDYTYTERVNSELKRLYSDYYYLQTVEVSSDTSGTTKKFKRK